MTPRVALIGAAGHGASHLRTIRQLESQGKLKLAGACDVKDVAVPDGVPFFRYHRELLDTVSPDVVVISTPPHTHLPIAVDAARAGADLLLEKPPVLDVAEHETLAAVLAETGRVCQVGFQALGSAALTALKSAIAAGDLGTVLSIAARGAWFRNDAYFSRAAWVGKRRLGDRAVVDGALANPFAHAVMQVLALAEEPVVGVEVERYRTRPIEVDDTACLRLQFASGVVGMVAVTLCAEEFVAGDITVTGTAGTAVLEYPTDRLRLPGQPDLIEVPGRIGLLANLIDHRADPQTPLVAPLSRTLPFTSLLAPILAVEPVPIPEKFHEVRHDLATPRIAVVGVNAAVDAACRDLRLYSELDIAWARKEDR